MSHKDLIDDLDDGTPDDKDIQLMAGRQRGDEDGHWTIDKRIPLALIIIMLGQTGGIGWWMATQQAMTNSLDRRVTALEPQVQKLPEQLAHMEEKVGFLQSGIEDIKQSVRTVLTTVAQPPQRPTWHAPVVTTAVPPR